MNEAKRFVVCSGDGDRFDVIVGHKLNARPLSQAEAYRLAGWSSPAGSSSGFSWNGNLVSGDKAMTTAPEQADFEDWPAEADPVRVAALPLVEVVMEITAPGSRERALAMSVVLAAVERIKQALAPKPRLQ